MRLITEEKRELRRNLISEEDSNRFKKDHRFNLANYNMCLV